MFRPFTLRALLLALASLAFGAGDSLAGPVLSNPYPDVFLSSVPAGGSIQVSNASYQTGAGYDGEGHVVGPMVGNTIVPFNLKSYNGMNFLTNSGSDRI